MQHFHAARALPAPWCQVCWKPPCHCHRFYISFPRCVPSTSAGGSISRLSYEPTASWARANTGIPRTWRREGMLGQPNSTARCTEQFRYYRKRSISFCTAFIRVGLCQDHVIPAEPETGAIQSFLRYLDLCSIPSAEGTKHGSSKERCAEGLSNTWGNGLENWAGKCRPGLWPGLSVNMLSWG